MSVGSVEVVFAICRLESWRAGFGAGSVVGIGSAGKGGDGAKARLIFLPAIVGVKSPT